MKPEDLTAWALDELSPEDRAAAEAALGTDAKTQEDARSTRSFCDFLSRELMDGNLALKPAQRAAILAARSNGQPRMVTPFQPRPLRWFQRPAIPMAAAAAVIVLGSLAALHLSQSVRDAGLEHVPDPSEVVRISGEKRSNSDVAKSIGAPPMPGKAPSAASILLTEPSGSPAAVPALAATARPASPPPPPVLKASNLMAETMTLAAGPAASGAIGRGLQPGADSTTSLGLLDKEEVHGSHMRRETRSTEEYSPVVENPLVSVVREPLSTFSTDVDTASYANVRRFLNQGIRPPREAVRIEELINYFPSPEPGPTLDAVHPILVKAEMAACPWQSQHRLARIHLKARDVPTGSRPGNLVFLVDVSGSMNSEDKLPLVQRSLRMLVEQLGEADRVAMVTYAGGTEVVLPSTNGLKKAEVLAAVDRLHAGGSTHGSAGIRLAYEQAVAGFIQGGVNRVILCTDGDFNVGISNPKELADFIADQARSGVFLSVLGFGSGNLKDRTLETLADKGNGAYALIDSVSEARKVLVEQMQGTLVTVAKDVKVQVEFNPAAVREYRLIGYENRLLAKEDFNDDGKDAGDVGAGHSVVALYELVPAGLPPGAETRPLVDRLKYQPEEIRLAAPPSPSGSAAGSLEALTVKVRYKEPEGNVSRLVEVALKDDERPVEKAGREFKFTAAVAGFGLLLRESPHAGQLSWDLVRRLAREGKGEDALGYRGEFLQLIEKAAAR
jgi:secreted protein with Ig-like and vWFA domain